MAVYEIERLRLPLITAASANQNIAHNIPREKPDDPPPYFAHTQKHSKAAVDWWIPGEERERKKKQNK